MVKAHIKRMNAPKRWEVLRKSSIFITRPNAGRDFTLCISLNTALKEMLGKTQTSKESKYLIKNQGVLVNARPVHDEKFPVGFLDVISLPALEESYRLLVNEKNRLYPLKISPSDAKLKLSKVANIKRLSKELVQVNCSDGRNFTFQEIEPILKDLKTNDSLLYIIPEQKAQQLIKLGKGSLVFLYKGKHIGNLVVVDDFKGANIVFRLNNEVFETKKAYAFAVGKDQPAIALTQNAYEKKIVAADPAKPAKESKAADSKAGIHKK